MNRVLRPATSSGAHPDALWKHPSRGCLSGRSPDLRVIARGRPSRITLVACSTLLAAYSCGGSCRIGANAPHGIPSFARNENFVTGPDKKIIARKIWERSIAPLATIENEGWPHVEMPLLTGHFLEVVRPTSPRSNIQKRARQLLLHHRHAKISGARTGRVI